MASVDRPLGQIGSGRRGPPRFPRGTYRSRFIADPFYGYVSTPAAIRSDQTMGARQMTVNIDLLDAELKVAQTECDDIDTAMAQIAADDVDAKAKFIELSERRKIAGERLSRISTALTEARSGSA
jgi:hypothetical protein